MEADLEEQENPLKGVPKMPLPKDKFLQISYPVYKPSLYCQLLKSEAARILYAESIGSETRDTGVPRLIDLCRNFLANQYKSGSLDPRLSDADLMYIGALLDVNMPLIDIVDLKNDAFWKRVFEARCNDRKLKCSKLHNINTNFKVEAIQVKLAEVIETTTYEFWDDDEMVKLAQAVAPYVNSLHISKLTPMKENMIDRDHNLSSFKIYNYPAKDCHHGNLDMIGYLTNLVKLEIELLPPPLGYEYHRRFFLFSYSDIENLARGLQRLTFLTHLAMKRSRLDDRKMKILVRGLLNLPLEVVEFSYCELRDKAGLCIAKLLQNVSSIRVLELEGNYLGKDGLEPIAYAIRNYLGFLEYYGLARNPISDEGVYMVGSGFLGNNQVQELNLNGIEVTQLGAKHIIEMIELHGKLQKVEMCAIPLGEEGGELLVSFLKGNKLLHYLEFRGCNLTLDQEYKVRLLVSRNKYFFDNPALMDEVTTKEMEDDANNWAKRVKHPVLLKVNTLMKKKEKCLSRRNVEVTFEEEELNPFFIHKKAIVQKTNSELLMVDFLESGEMEAEPPIYIPTREKDEIKEIKVGRRFEYEPNAFEEKEILRNIRIGQTDRPHYNYFQPKAKASRRSSSESIATTKKEVNS